MKISLSTYLTPGFSHISQVLYACIIDKTNGFTEQQATWQVATHNCPFSVMDLKLGSLQTPLASIYCTLSTAEMLIHIWVFPNTYSISTISYLTKMFTKKAYGDISPLCNWTYSHLWLSGCQLSHDCSQLVLLWCGVTYSCYYKYSPSLKPSVLQTAHLCPVCVTIEKQSWGLYEQQSWISDLNIILSITDWNCSHIQHLLPQPLSLSMYLFYSNH